MVTVPLLTPVTTPPVPTVAMAVFAEVHEPPGAEDVSVISLAAQNTAAPESTPAKGTTVTVTIAVVVQPAFV